VWCEDILGSRLFLRHGFEWQCALQNMTGRPARANKLKSPDIWELAICLPGRGKLYCQRLQPDRASKSRQGCKDLAASMRFLNEI
jgi:hypothetical protein